DYYTADIGEILIDTEDIYEQAKGFMGHVMPGTVNRVKLYNDDVPLFSRFQIEHQIESAFGRTVNLPSGGAIVIDHTEALVSVDVNSARATKGGDIETTAFNTNMEAADEVARQLRLRDLGGLIVVDFIDMESSKHQREVEDKLRDSMKLDRARVQLGKISRFGLMELSRQRLKPSLGESAHLPCPRCHGTGHIRSTESIALHILRIIQEEAMKDNSAQVVAQVPVDVATYLLNEKRVDLQSLESRLKVNVVLIPNLYMETPNYTVQRLKHDELNHAEPLPLSFKMVERPVEIDVIEAIKQEANEVRVEAVVKGITPAHSAPNVEPKAIAAPAAPVTTITAPQPAPKAGFWASFKSMFGGSSTATELVAQPAKAAEPKQEPKREGNRDRNDRGDRNGRRSRGEGSSDRNDRNGRGSRSDSNKDRNDRGSDAKAGRNDRSDRGERKGQGQGQGERQQRDQKPVTSTNVDMLNANVSNVANIEASKPQREPREPREQREPREPRAERSERGPRRERGERSDRAPRDTTAPINGELPLNDAAAPAVAVEAGDVNAVAAPQERTDRPPRNERGSRRRDRGDREGRPDRDNAGAPGQNGEGRRERGDGESSSAAADASTYEAAAPAPQFAPAYVAPVPAPAPMPAPAPVVAAPAPAPEVKREPAKAFSYTLPTDAGLQMMETKASGAPAQLVVDEPVKRGRARPPRATAAAEPMQMVETGGTSTPANPQ
ncbi:MAG: ribonuclease E/G, partial [Casimicrobium sp.]